MPDTPSPLQLAWNRLILLLHELRLRRGWTVEELAKQAGVSRTTLYYLERGETSRPRMGTLRKLSTALGDELLPLLTELAKLPPDQAPALIFDGEFDDSEEFNEDILAREFDEQTNPEVRSLAQNEPELFQDWSTKDWHELYSTMGMGGALNPEGVRAQVLKIGRKRETLAHLEIILETHLGPVAIALVESLYEQVQLKGNTGLLNAGWQPPPRDLPPGVHKS